MGLFLIYGGMGMQNTGNLVRALIIKDDNSSQAQASNVPDSTETWKDVANKFEPPYNLSYLLRLPEYSNILQECIDAYASNIPGFGWEIVSVIDTNTRENDDKDVALAKTQKEEVEFLLKTCNYKETFTGIMKMVVRNREACGIGYVEVLPNSKGVVSGFEAIKDASKVRILRPVDWVMKEVTCTLDSGKKSKLLPTKFYRFAYEDGASIIYFKEYGDNRIMDKKSGEYKTAREVKPADRATSLIPFRLPCSYSPYGIPRYIGKVPCIVGSRKSEELNIKYFENGRVVPAAIIVENGKLTTESYSAIQSNKGVDMSFKWILLEATGAETTDSIIEGENDKNKVKVDIKPLTEMIQQDGLFQEYDSNNRGKIRSSFRVPPIYTGESSDYTKSTAQIARAVAEALVFQPEREELAEPINKIIREMGYDLVELRFKAPKLTDKFELSKALTPYITSGTATPNMLLESLGELIGKRFSPLKDAWADKPLALVLKEMDKEMIVAQAEANSGKEGDTSNADPNKKNTSGDVTKGAEIEDGSDAKVEALAKQLIIDILKTYKEGTDGKGSKM